jgi:hypothetical protein
MSLKLALGGALLYTATCWRAPMSLVGTNCSRFGDQVWEPLESVFLERCPWGRRVSCERLAMLSHAWVDRRSERSAIMAAFDVARLLLSVVMLNCSRPSVLPCLLMLLLLPQPPRQELIYWCVRGYQKEQESPFLRTTTDWHVARRITQEAGRSLRYSRKIVRVAVSGVEPDSVMDIST